MKWEAAKIEPMEIAQRLSRCSVLGLELTDHPLDGGAPSHLFV
jgi:hypothetical protein